MRVESLKMELHLLPIGNITVRYAGKWGRLILAIQPSACTPAYAILASLIIYLLILYAVSPVEKSAIILKLHSY